MDTAVAHVAKIKMAALDNMVGHYNREAEARGYERDNIDGSRTADNYAVGAATPGELAEAVRAAVGDAAIAHTADTGKRLRKDANVMLDWVVTAPRDLPSGRERDFFDAVVSFVRGRYGSENVPGGFVHMDEATPHVHVPVVPRVGDRLVSSKVVNRADLKTFHKDLGAAVDEALGCHVSIELGEEQKGLKQLSHLSQDEYVAAKETIAAMRDELDLTKRELSEAREDLAAARESEAMASEMAERQTRRAQEAMEEAKEWREAASRARREAVEAKEALWELQGQARTLMERLAGIVDALRVVMEGKGLFEPLVEWMRRFSDNVHVKAGYEAARSKRPMSKGYVRAAEGAIVDSAREEAGRLAPEVESLASMARGMVESSKRLAEDNRATDEYGHGHGDR